MAVVIFDVTEKSPADLAGIKVGEILLSINGNEIQDVLDYRFYMTDAHLKIVLRQMDGTERICNVSKDEYDDLGLEFETYLMDAQRFCKNKCIFCFVDQTPKGMRETLYFKDDDSRMSFLFGNYITLTNLTDHAIDRIIKMRISPINVSVHTTNPELRVKMMANPKAGTSLAYLKRLTDSGIKVNTQLVLCPGFNDGEELERSLRELGEMLPHLQSIAVVPVGLTRHRENLTALTPFDAESAGAVIDAVHSFSDRMLALHGARVAYPADEFFLKAGRKIPAYEYYGDFDQLENGVGLMAVLRDEFLWELEEMDGAHDVKHLSIATGVAAYELMCSLVDAVHEKFPRIQVTVHRIVNRFFGENITVAGLITGQDLLGQLEGISLGEKLLIPSVMLRHEQDKFLDDVTLEEVREKLGVPVEVVENDGAVLLNRIVG